MSRIEIIETIDVANWSGCDPDFCQCPECQAAWAEVEPEAGSWDYSTCRET